MIRPSRAAIVHLALGAFALLLVLRSAYLQLWEGRALSARAAHQYFQTDTVIAPRGDILDESGIPLVQSIEKSTVAIAPKELFNKKDSAAVRSTLRKLGLPSAVQRRAMDASRRWVPLPGNYMPAQLASIRGVRGVYPELVVQRENFASAGISAFIGRVGPDGSAEGGLERILDSQLRGAPGLIKRVNDPRGRPDFEVPVSVLRESVRGNSVTLTINKALQGIAENTLADAVKSRGARRGDIVIIDPHTGEIRAIASYSETLGFATSDVISEPYEPGSSIKPLLVSRLLDLHRARSDEVVETGLMYQLPGRPSPIRDDHWAPSRSLHDVIVYSSNIGMVKFTSRLSVQEQYEAYRDFGLGMQTGVTLPAEAAGSISSPEKWTVTVKSSTAYGYAMSVTSLQLAMAYGSIANGGELLEPTIVKEIRNPGGDVLFRHEPRTVRRVMSPATAAEVRAMLRDVVVSGTASTADLSLGELAGKTGTARLVDGPLGYATHKYTATFAGMFPARDPQFVIVVRLVDPTGDIYGGLTAAPVMSAVLKAAAIAQDAALDTRNLITPSQSLASLPGDKSVAADLDQDTDEEAAVPEVQQREFVRLINLSETAKSRGEERMARPVPRVDGMPLRAAVYQLHQAGFKVRLRNTSEGADGTTSPAAGSVRKPGELILLYKNQ